MWETVKNIKDGARLKSLNAVTMADWLRSPE